MSPDAIAKPLFSAVGGPAVAFARSSPARWSSYFRRIVERAIGRAAVDDDQFDVRIRLQKDRPDRMLDERPLIERGMTMLMSGRGRCASVASTGTCTGTSTASRLFSRGPGGSSLIVSHSMWLPAFNNSAVPLQIARDLLALVETGSRVARGIATEREARTAATRQARPWRPPPAGPRHSGPARLSRRTRCRPSRRIPSPSYKSVLGCRRRPLRRRACRRRATSSTVVGNVSAFARCRYTSAAW